MRYFQFIGTQRSGSNLLRVMLNQLPEISAPHPPHILKTFFPLLSRYGDLSVNDNFLMLVNDVCDWVNCNPVAWDPYVANPDRIASDVRSKDLLGIFMALSEAKAIADGAVIVCCKSMESVSYVRQIEAAGLYPVYIHLYRDGRDVALSFMKAVVGPKHIYSLARKWRQDQLEAMEAKSIIPPERFVSLRYEELIENPEIVLKNLCDALKVPYRSEMLNYFEAGESKRTAHAGKMWENLEKPVMASNRQKFLKGLSKEQLIIFESVAGDMLFQLGYDLVTTDLERRDKFSAEEVEAFELGNKKLIQQALSTADPEDLKKRKPQEDLLKKIMNR